jgi:hypothetical protein
MKKLQSKDEIILEMSPNIKEIVQEIEFEKINTQKFEEFQANTEKNYLTSVHSEDSFFIDFPNFKEIDFIK